MTNWKKVGEEALWFDKERPLGTHVKVNDSIEGRYINKREDVGDHQSNIHVLETEKGALGVWGSTVLDGKMLQVAIGKMAKIVYLGKKTPKKGGKDYHDWDVFYGVDTPEENEGGEGMPY